MTALNNNSIQMIQKRIANIREEHDINERIRMLHSLNNLLPAKKRLDFPSLITNAYIRKALDEILERAMSPIIPA